MDGWTGDGWMDGWMDGQVMVGCMIMERVDEKIES
jgi:hypothetical protein